MKVLFASEGIQELEISGTNIEWAAFSLALGQNRTVIPCDAINDPSPFSTSLQRICISHTPDQKVRLSVKNGTDLVIQGDRTLMEKLAATTNNLSNDFPTGSHIHIENHESQQDFIDRNSIPTVLSIA